MTDTAHGSETIREPFVAILVDFDNLFPPTQARTDSSVKHALSSLINFALDLVPEGRSIHIRLYGGWTADGSLSRIGSELAQLVENLNFFPFSLRDGSLVRGFVEMATSLLSMPGHTFGDLYRRRTKIPRLRLSASPLPDGCLGNESSCPAKALMRFTKGPRSQCPVHTCEVTGGTAFVAHEQKMVDTLLSCDLIELSSDPACRQVVVVTSDTDLIPPLMHARASASVDICLLPGDQVIDAIYIQVLQSIGIQVEEAV